MAILFRVTYKKRTSIRALARQALQPYTLRYLETHSHRSGTKLQAAASTHSHSKDEGSATNRAEDPMTLYNDYGRCL